MIHRNLCLVLARHRSQSTGIKRNDRMCHSVRRRFEAATQVRRFSPSGTLSLLVLFGKLYLSQTVENYEYRTRKHACGSHLDDITHKFHIPHAFSHKELRSRYCKKANLNFCQKLPFVADFASFQFFSDHLRLTINR